jgi:hypothetical protein
MKPHTAYAVRTLAFLAVIIAILAGAAWLTMPPADAAPAAVQHKAEAGGEYLGQYRLPAGRKCFEDKGWTRWGDVLPNVAWRLRANGVTDAVVWDDCSSQPDSQVVTLAVSNDPSSFYCARTERGGYVNGVAQGRTVIRFNMAPVWFDRCHATWSQRAHVMSHETGHALGLVHVPGDDSVMGAEAWPVLWFTERDYRDMAEVYR